ncbi:GNAT family N-acetyltransferase [Pelagibius sp.]|uniref:GNAT family N-acetyltransferase n=1 Tax=Pelagibius sp. TaxID=1931238 RepID=UPI0026241FA0|nr:GNAT family N-acetyltransferase [Pelagibius sp.]
MAASLEIRPISRQEFETAVSWARAEGWNPGLADGDCFYACDPAGYLMAFEDGQPLASISVVAYGEAFGFLGFYICRPERRGEGIGYRLWQAGLARLGERTIGLDGVVDQQENYRKEGFVLEHRNVRYGGRVDCAAPEDPRLRTIGPEEVEAIMTYDQPFFPAPRADFLRNWLQRSDVRFGSVLVEDGAVRGYGVLRRCHEGFKVGPLFADDRERADLLFRSLAAETKGEPVFLDPPQPNGAAVRLAESYSMTPVFETARMYRGPAPKLPLERTFGITTFELG